MVKYDTNVTVLFVSRLLLKSELEIKSFSDEIIYVHNFPHNNLVFHE